MKRKTKVLLIVTVLLLCLVLPGFYSALTIPHYTVEAEQIRQPVRIALITDLHSCAYGENQRELLAALDGENPDAVLLGGDIFDDTLPVDNAAAFLRGVGGRYPCYYVTGNHEYWVGAAGFAERMAILEECGVTRLSGGTAALEINGSRIVLCGVDDPYAWADCDGFTEHASGSFREQVARTVSQAEPGAFTILLTHRPELLDVYSQYGIGLVLAGHAHGGQWRIPGLVNGLWAPHQGLFPAYAGGQYEKNGVRMIVSRGLARESTRVPRWYNRPELVMVELR